MKKLAGLILLIFGFVLVGAGGTETGVLTIVGVVMAIGGLIMAWNFERGR